MRLPVFLLPLLLVCPAHGGDLDGDGLPDPEDLCVSVPTPEGCGGIQVDSDSDGYGNHCDGDYDQDNVVGLSDWNSLRRGFQGSVSFGGPELDVNCDGYIGIADVTFHFVPQFLGQPGPSGLRCAGRTPCPEPEGWQEDSPDDRKDFTIIALPDTQSYVRDASPIFSEQMQWIVEQRSARNIVFVTHLGDAVENASRTSEWQFVDEAFRLIEDPVSTGLPQGIPYGIAVGNHDRWPLNSTDPGSTPLYNAYFGASRFLGRSYYWDFWDDPRDPGASNNHAQLFSASGMDFLVIHLEYFPSMPQATLDWAEDMLETHADRRAIVVSHYILRPGIPGAFGRQGQKIYDSLKDQPNLFLMLSGHLGAEGRRTDVFDGNTVHSLLADYQGRANGGDGWLRILTFSPSADEIQVETYSPTLDRFESDTSSRFTLSYDMGD